ncbi:chitin synthase-domain-containing protein [Cokeromyces recurvatus]|uniref:chitin synthase-domain-containing protein n=1 Tax=Cokeromyces recurvatus TaxID=90255 RepID=UPI00221F3694|nr:chitin synthase-domain-containing protein [Cokeromyces recurvatus]KAI7901255.1 chitin synthase-domain-containing protein [Cokeromyces recurvatus]
MTTSKKEFDLLGDEVDEDGITETLRCAFQSNVIYSRISDTAIIALNPYKSMPLENTSYVAEYKDPDGLEPLPTHLYKIVNQAYLHMRRTGIDQSLILCGESGSGKTESFKLALNHLIQLSSHKKESKLQAQITNVQIILEAFGNCATSVNTNASRFGKYMELQFNERGRMVGTKILNYLLDKSRMIQAVSREQTFHIFYQLFAGCTNEEKAMLQLNDEVMYRYIPRIKAANGSEANQFRDLKQAMRVLGINKKYQARIWQLLACLLHLGQLEFLDQADDLNGGAIIAKNTRPTLDLCADFLGVDPLGLETVLTYKTQLIKKDITTIILDSTGAAKQRDDIVRSLYSLLFTWLVEFMNNKLYQQGDNFNFIGLLDFPGPYYHQDTQHFYGFCINFANERLHHFCQRTIFEMDLDEYRQEGIMFTDIPYFSNQACVELLMRPKQGLVDIINQHTSKMKTSSDTSNSTILSSMVASFSKYNTNHASFKQLDPKQRLFAIQHFSGQAVYSPDDFLQSNWDILNPDLVQLIRGVDNEISSYNSFLVEIFGQGTNMIQIEHHPKQSNAILNAQQPTGPVRGPSMRRSKSTKLKRTTLDPINKEVIDKSKSGVRMVLSQLKQNMDDLFIKTLEETVSWFVFCIKPNDHAAPNQFDTMRVKQQIRAAGLPQIAQRLQTQYANVMFQDEFMIRYKDVVFSPKGYLEKATISQNTREQCQIIINCFGWTVDQVALGTTKIFLKESVWLNLEDMMRVSEKAEQRRLRDEKRVNENMATLAAPVMNMDGGDHSFETISNMSYGSNTDFLLLPENQQQRHHPHTHYDAAAAAAAAVVAANTAGLPLPPSVYTDDQRSFLSDDEFQHNHSNNNNYYHDTDSQYGTSSDIYGASQTNLELRQIMLPTTDPIEIEKPSLDKDDNDEEATKVSRVRRHWLNFVWFMTWWIPTSFLSFCGKMKRPDIQIAWREKMTLCMCIFLTSGFIIWFLVFFGSLVCPHQDVFSTSELQSHSDDSNAYVAIRGEVFDLTKFAPHHWATQVIPTSAILQYGGKDASSLFPVQVSALCEGVTGTVSPYVSLDFNTNLTDTNAQYHNFLPNSGDPRPDWYFQQMSYLRKNYKLGTMGYTPKDIATQATNPVDMSGIKTTRQWAILNHNVYDLTYYILGGRRFELPEGVAAPDAGELNFLDTAIVTLFSQKAGQDITASWNALPLDPAVKSRQMVCLRNLYHVGTVDERNSARCLFAEYLLLIVTVFLCMVILFKFLAALQFRTRREPEKHEKFVICQVPCYTEGEEELRKTIDSISSLQYDDKRKLLFIICDGMIVGGGNDRPTPRIVLDILGVDPNIDPEPLSFFSVGEGQKQHNMGKIYSGLYECRGHVVPYIVVSKVGKPSERQKPGNRGKRDSQLILMNFLNKVHFGSPMTPFELELYHQIKNVIGVNPSFYEYVLMVDADTEVMPDGLNRMISVFAHDAKIIGLCGETVLSNEKDSWVTMIQVYEYFISHYMIKAFESLFGSVTCLPGCFCMYRVRSPQKNQPLLVSNAIIEEYSINKVDTLHKKNLLHLGEDRYLTTLILKHFPNHKTKFVSDAKCATNAPDRWSVLLSQRRRWINSTIHNLGELVFLPQLCGFCCFSMRFVVMLDLLSTLVQPAIVGYLIYLIYMLVTSTSGVPIMSIITIAGVYGLQAIIFLLHRKWEHIIWMIVSIFAIPVFSFMIPIYAYWHFDDFSWGNTRVVLGEKGTKKVVAADEGKFDPSSIPVMTWEEYEQQMMYFDDGGYDNASVGSGYSQGSYYSQQSYQKKMMMQQQPLRGTTMSPAFQRLPPYQSPTPGYSTPPSMMGYYHDNSSRPQSPFH